MSFYEDNKEKINSFIDSLREGVECDDQAMILDAIQRIPEDFWKDRECSTRMMEAFFGWVGSEFFVYPVYFIPDFFWKDEETLWSYVVTLCEFYEEERIDYNLTELFPEELLKDQKVLQMFLYYNYFEIVSYIPEKYKGEKEIWLWALEGLQHEIERREYNCNSWRLPLNKRECLESFISEIPKTLSTDEDFVMELVVDPYFFNEIDLLYDWVDEKFWGNQVFVEEVLKAGENLSFKRISKELFSHSDFMEFLEERFELGELSRELAEQGEIV